MRAREVTRRAAIPARAAPAFVALLLATGACSSSSDSFDRGKAVDAVLTENHGRLTRQQAECYVDRVVHDLGSDALDTSTAPPPERVPRLTAIQIDCIGVVNLGTPLRTSSTTVAADDSGGTRPQRLGDDPHLDELYRACKATGGAACDQLFDEAPLGSDYETFASTCGGRTQEVRCADRYPAPGATPSSTAPAG